MPDEAPPYVLCVDDEEDNLRVFRINFENRFRLLLARSGPGALELLQARQNEIGVIITDQRMPEMTGVELLERAVQIAPDVQRMVITAYADMQAVIDSVNRGQVSRYFVKPWNREELGNAIGDALRIFTLQQRLRRIEVALLQSERLATIGQVSAGIAHELMNPVSYVGQAVVSLKADFDVVSSHLRRSLAQAPEPAVSRALDEMSDLLSDLETGIRHIRQVATSVRSQVQGVDTETTADLQEVVQFAVKLARSEIRDRARLTANGRSLWVEGGPVRLTQVLVNLIVNAAQAIPDGRFGLIEILWRPLETGWALLTVRDTGAGMPPEVLARAFERGFTTKPAGIGTGLGLPICKDLIEEMGGTISLLSKVGVGTTVEMKLRLAQTT